MSDHHYEYNVLVECINTNDTLKYPHFSHLNYQEGLTKTFEEVFGHLCESVSESCEIISHNITNSQDTYILTVLLKRKKAEVLP